ncbi:MAG: hypothetical protein D3925_16365 [Candidatus Electrothrix sp. AR5]|nr:hypothetical protein [Candidatus Electrothrix sp. AR5]
MPGLPFFDDSTPQPIHAPAIEISFSGGSDNGGFGGMVDAAASMLGGPSALSWADHLISISLELGFAPSVDSVDLLISGREGAHEAALGDQAVIAMGSADHLQDLFTGTVVAIEKRGDGTCRYQFSNGSYDLAHTRINQSVNEMSVQDAISFATDQLSLSLNADVSTSDDTLPQVVFDHTASLWDHITYLAGLRGLNLWFDADNSLQLADQLEQGESVASFTWGEDLLEANIWQRAAHSGAITAFGGGRIVGDFTLRKQATPNRAEQGDGTPQRFYRDGVLQSPQDLTTRAGAATLFAQRQTALSEVMVSGSSLLRPGKVIELTNLQEGSDGNYLIHHAHHSFNHTEGWRTRLTISSTSAASSGLGGLL